MDKKNQCGVYRLFKLSKGVGNTFTEEFKKLERDLHVVNHNYADLINQNSFINGSLYEYDEKASDLYWNKKPYRNQDVNSETEGIVTIKTIEEVDQEIKEANYRLEYEELSGKKAHHLWKIDKLIEKIEELKK
jgi:hypothetical protein